ncbi:MAG: hypothetical protein IPN01_14965 [Deltaproteobacteria bacterium]|nr:hypothetical protein [Deltaproteobacteria bacterium]
MQRERTERESEFYSRWTLNGQSDLSFLGEATLEARVPALEALCRRIARQLPVARSGPALPLFDQVVSDLAFLRVALRVAREVGVRPDFIPAFLQLLALPRLVQVNLPDARIEWPNIPVTAYTGRDSRVRRMLFDALVVDDAGWLDCVVRRIARKDRSDPMFANGFLWPTQALQRDAVAAFPIAWAERLTPPATHRPTPGQTVVQIGMWRPLADQYNARGAEVGWRVELRRPLAEHRRSPEEQAQGPAEDIGDRLSDRNPMAIPLGDGWTAAVRVQISRADLGPRGAISPGSGKNLTLHVTGSSGRGEQRGVPPAVPAAGFTTASWGRPPRLELSAAGRVEYEAAVAAGSPFVALGPEDAQMSFDQTVGPDGGRPSAGGWDTIPLTMGGEDAVLWCAIAWARVAAGPHRAALPLPSRVSRPGAMVGARWMAAFTAAEVGAVRELLRVLLLAGGNADLKARVSRQDLPASQAIFEGEVRKLPASSIDELFGRLVTHFHAPPDAAALQTYLRRWLAERIASMSGQLDEQMEARTKRKVRAALTSGAAALSAWLAADASVSDQPVGARRVLRGRGKP